jgi:hypothetical protein
VPTRYDADRQASSDVAHLAARRDIYPRLFGVPAECLQYAAHSGWATERDRWLDAELAIDTTVGITITGLRRPLPFYIQERFRGPASMHFADATVTEWSNATGQPNELYKGAADYFVYGYYDNRNDRFLDWVAVNWPSVKRAVVGGKLALHRCPDNDKHQSVMGMFLNDLARFGMRQRGGRRRTTTARKSHEAAGQSTLFDLDTAKEAATHPTVRS